MLHEMSLKDVQVRRVWLRQGTPQPSRRPAQPAGPGPSQPQWLAQLPPHPPAGSAPAHASPARPAPPSLTLRTAGLWETHCPWVLVLPVQMPAAAALELLSGPHIAQSRSEEVAAACNVLTHACSWCQAEQMLLLGIPASFCCHALLPCLCHDSRAGQLQCQQCSKKSRCRLAQARVKNIFAKEGHQSSSQSHLQLIASQS